MKSSNCVLFLVLDDKCTIVLVTHDVCMYAYSIESVTFTENDAR